MKKIFTQFVLFVLLGSLSVNAETLQAGVSVNEIPKDFFGSWQIVGSLEKTNSPKTFKGKSSDYWNLSRKGDVLYLENPLNGANAEVSVDNVEGNLVTFTRKVSYDNNKVLTDTVTLRIDGKKFTGLNNLKLEHYSLVDNHLIKTETALYKIIGNKYAN